MHACISERIDSLALALTLALALALAFGSQSFSLFFWLFTNMVRAALYPLESRNSFTAGCAELRGRHFHLLEVRGLFCFRLDGN